MSVDRNKPSVNSEPADSSHSPSLSAKMCRAWKTVVNWAQDMITDPPTTLNDCFNAFFDTNELTGIDVDV